MTPFPLKIVTAEGIQFDGAAESLALRTTVGEIGILAGHMNYAAIPGDGIVCVTAEETVRRGRCKGGLLQVVDGCVTMIPTAFVWEES